MRIPDSDASRNSVGPCLLCGTPTRSWSRLLYAWPRNCAELVWCRAQRAEWYAFDAPTCARVGLGALLVAVGSDGTATHELQYFPLCTRHRGPALRVLERIVTTCRVALADGTMDQRRVTRLPARGGDQEDGG